MEELKTVNKIKAFLTVHHDKKAVKDTIDELCNKGVAKGCYQDYGLLIALLDIICTIEEDVK